MKNIHTFLLIAIIFLGATFRLVGFPSTPSGLNRDEAALGFNAYAILKTGKDEWGVSFPVTFRSFGDYKLAGYIYTLVPFVKLFGLNQTAVRLPSLLAGVLLPLAAYLLMKEMLGKNSLALLAAFILALSPWAIYYSKIGFEANLALTLFIFGMTFLLKSRKRKVYSLFATTLLFFSLLTYNAPLIILPFVLLLIFLWDKRTITTLLAVCIATLIAFVLIYPATKGKGSISIFSDQGLGEHRRAERLAAGNNLLKKIQFHPLTFYTVAIMKKYSQHYKPMFLVIRGGGNPWHQPPGRSHLTWGLYVLALFGAIVCIEKMKKPYLLLLGLLFIAPLPSAITVDAPHATRSLFFLFMLSCMAAISLNEIWKKWKMLSVVILAILLFETNTYAQDFFRSLTPQAESIWNAGVSEALQKAETLSQHKKTITFVGDTHYTYILPLFYMHVDPEAFRKTVEYYPQDLLGLSQVRSFNNYIFVSDERDAVLPSVLIQQKASGEYVVEEK